MTVKQKMKSMDGNRAAAHIAYAFTEAAAIYPITPSSTMAEHVDEWAAHDKKNIFGETVKVVEMQSEAGAVAVLHGALQAGALSTTFTASQGLLMMIPSMYKISAELLPAVFHVSARALSTHALSIFGDHSDIYSVRQTGFAILASGGVQEVMDLGSVAHLAAIKSQIPFVHFFDGFRTSHEIQKIGVIEHEELRDILDEKAIHDFRAKSLNPENPVTRGTAQNPDIYFQGREVTNSYYMDVPDIVENYMQKIRNITGREYHPFNYYGDPEAEDIIVAMGSVTDTIAEAVDYLMERGTKVGMIAVHLYRPFSEKYFMKVLPKTVKRIAVLDRTKEPGANGEPLYLDIRDLFYGTKNPPVIVGGRYGLGSKDTTPTQILTVFENLRYPEPKNGFTIGINDDLTFTSLPEGPQLDTVPESTFQAKFYGIGSDGTVGANKNSIKIIGDNTDLYAQAYFAYDSKKSGGVTVSHLRFGKNRIKSTYLITHADFVACHVPSYIEKFDMFEGMKDGGTFLFNSMWDEEETKKHMPDRMKKFLARHNIKFYIINATRIAEDIGLGNRTNSIMQAAFFKLSGVIPPEDAARYMKDAIKKTYGRKGDDIVNMNCEAIDRGITEVHQIYIPEEWKEIKVKERIERENVPEFVREIADPMNRLEGDSLPVSAFRDFADGTFPAGTTKYEKRGIAVHVPEWISKNCIQCNFCSFVCPHAAIRPFLLNKEEVAAIPAGVDLVEAKGKGLEGLKYRMEVSPLDCTGCGNCVQVCPAKEKALEMKTFDQELAEAEVWEHMVNNVTYKTDLVPRDTVKGSQFAQPLFEFSGACAGCGETPYIKVITQLFGDQMMVANATGCSSIFGGSAPSTPYCTNANGHGPAWASSLFEDTAEYGYGMHIGVEQIRNWIESMAMDIINGTNACNIDGGQKLKKALKKWIDSKQSSALSRQAAAELIPLLEEADFKLAKEILRLKKFLVKKSQWIIGGDGWAYDIGFGGLDHVLAENNDVNILVLDTEVYSNTGGQSSKSTPAAAVAKFASAGKQVRKKNLGMLAESYGYVYVAQVAMGASYNQYMQAIMEAEAYPGPSLVIAYCPCINHGIRTGMGFAQLEQKRAVECGYWVLYRYNPLLELEGKNPFILDSKEPDWSKFREFLMGEVRYTSLKKEFPETAEDLYVTAEKNAKWRYERYDVLSSIEVDDNKRKNLKKAE